MTFRKVHLSNDDVWEYYIGKGLNVVIKSPKGKKVIVDACKITGRSDATLERGQRKRTSDGMIKPSHIKNYIELHLA